MTLPTCEHADTFDCHGNVRCSACYVDAMYLPEPYDGASMLTDKGWAVWPSQDHPMDWTAERIATWFLGRHINRKSQGCDGFEFCRNNLTKPRSLYGYVWVVSTLDLDLDFAWLLDVRRTTGTRDEFDEDRQLLFVTSGISRGNTAIFHPTAVPFLGPHPSPADDLRWFAEQVDLWWDR